MVPAADPVTTVTVCSHIEISQQTRAWLARSIRLPGLCPRIELEAWQLVKSTAELASHKGAFMYLSHSVNRSI